MCGLRGLRGLRGVAGAAFLFWMAGANAAHGQDVKLSYAGGTFSARSFTPVGEQQFGGIVVAPGLRRPPNDPWLIGPLSEKLAQAGWRVLALKMRRAALDAPISAQRDWLADTRARMAAGIAQLTADKSTNNVLIGLGAGGDAVLEAVLEGKQASATGWVAIAPAGTWGGTANLSANRLPGLLWVKPSRFEYWRDASSGNNTQDYVAPRLIQGAGGGRWFLAERDRLIKRIRGWLAKNLARTEITK